MKFNCFPQHCVRLVVLAVGLHSSTAYSVQNSSASISQMMQMNMQDHPQLQALKAELRSAKAQVRAANQAIFNPELELDYEETDIETKSVGIRQTLDWGDQRGSRTAAAQAQFNHAMASYEQAIQTLLKEQLSRIAEYQTNQELKQLADEKLKLMLEFKQVSERRFEAGDLNQVERNLTQLSYSQAVMEQANVNADAIEAREALYVMFNNLPKELPHLPAELPPPELESDLEKFIQQLPAVRQTIAEINSARQTVKLRKSETAWNPTIGLSAGKEGDENLVGVNLSFPLNIRNNYSAEVDSANESLIAIEQRAHIAFREIRARIISTNGRYKALLHAWKNWQDKSRNSVDQQLILVKKMWQVGDISTADYLLQLKQALETKATGIELRNQLWQVAFEWMSMVSTLDDWLNIEIETEILNKSETK